MSNEPKELYDDINEIKTKIAILEDRQKQFGKIPTFEKIENMINRSIDSLPKEEKIIVLIQDTIRKENLVTKELLEKKIWKLKLWLYVSAVGLLSIGLKIFF
ncbi:hypothetical protein BKP37_05205 [Anaerobacillus alkalilacustris]|uniref:Uncharacterized protein n=1 Tax=Anaerobacillus alkalilacustris TaxID=393763 RepID=A0A1S2LWU1_9BACI|nr:hypothetical protein [Anaerobacillus alkalilacustris]OIJ16633.1 hypothetical protein BKP37_05205 [Anaerobacillus alkalilacustris]